MFQGRVRASVVAVCGMCRYPTVAEVSLSIEHRIRENTERDSFILDHYFVFCRLLDEICFEKASSLKSVVCLFSCIATVSLLPQACVCGGQCVVRAWSVCGQRVVSVWSMCGLCVVSVWSVCDQCVVSIVSVWSVYSQVSVWSMRFQVSVWSACGLCVINVWSVLLVCGQCIVRSVFGQCVVRSV